MERILLVGENDIVQKSIIRFLEENQLTYVNCETFHSGLSHIFKQKFSLIISHFLLDEGDAVQLASVIKGVDTINAITPFIVLSSEENILPLFSKEIRPNSIIKKGPQLLENLKAALEDNDLLQDGSNPLEVLYIDDDPLIRKMIDLWLRPIEDISLKVYSSVKEVKENRDQKFDLIISDNLLKDGNVVNVIEELNKGSNKGKPILVYTGSPDKVKNLGIEKMANVLDILPKPFELKKFLEIVKNIRKAR